MRKRVLRNRVLLTVAVILLLAVVVMAIVYFATRERGKGTLAEALVVRASLSSNLSSTGTIREVSTKVKVPLAALIAEDTEAIGDIEENDYTVNLMTLFGEEGDAPLVWRVKEVDADFRKKTVELSTEDESTVLMRLVPVVFDWERVTEHFEAAYAAGSTGASSVEEYVLSLLLRAGGSEIDTGVFPDEFWREVPSAAVSVESATISELLLAEMSYLDSLSYEISSLTWDEGDMLVLDNNLFTVEYREKFVGMMLSEYDVAPIHARMSEGERVYAAVSVNALSGRELLAEIVRIGDGKAVSGVTYYELLARLVFPEITRLADGTELGSYLYYDTFLTEDTVRYLGINLRENVKQEELLENYSVTVTAQKNVVTDTLIVPTKCIYYDDNRKPYVVVLDADKKESRVYIKITLSTGTDAAVTAADGYVLNVGDVMRYVAEASLLGSLF